MLVDFSTIEDFSGVDVNITAISSVNCDAGSDIWNRDCPQLNQGGTVYIYSIRPVGHIELSSQIIKG